ADKESDPVAIYTAANVIDGRFVYQGTPRSTRYTVCLVSWIDPANFYAPAVEYVEDLDGLDRYGVNQTSLTAIGCTSRAMARRIGKWALLSSLQETESVSFAVGLDGTFAAPGQLI